WQELSVEFEAPGATQRFWLALEKGTREPAEIDARLEQITVRPIERLSILEQYRLNPLPPGLQAVRGMHPRLYLDAPRIAALHQALRNTHASVWAELQPLADRAARRGPPPYRREDSYSGDEQLWQRDVGNTMPLLAMAWVLTGEARYLEAARAWALASCGYPTWGLGRIDGMDLATGHQLFGLAIVYDWCHADLGEDARRTIRETLVRRSSAMFEAAATGRAWWQQSYLQNHLWVNLTGMAAAGFALFDEVEDAGMWIGLSLAKFEQTMNALGADGASHEGVGYWEYGVEYMLKFMDLARDRLGVNLHDQDWWRNTARYAQYLALPRHAWSRNDCIVDLADCPRGHWYGPDYLLRGLAREFQDGHAQWLAAEVDQADVTAPGAPWLNLLWFDPGVPAVAPTSLPTLRHFDDMGIVSARTDWTGDESLLVFKCGPFIGHQAIREFRRDPGGGHVHPDANHFVLFGAGEWLIRDDGYRWKWTGQHNTLRVDGEGQVGEGAQWFQGNKALAAHAAPRILQAESTPGLDRITGDATEAYPADCGLRRFVRHLFFVKPDVLLVCDDVELDRPRNLELRFHPEAREASRDGNAFVMRGRKSTLRLEPLMGATGREISAGNLGIEDRDGGKEETMFTVRVEHRGIAWRNAVALTWCPADQLPKVITARTGQDRWQFVVGDRTLTFDWSGREATIQ
ncbi:MAG: heparinase II/III family protein, partial [Verrucomicrobiae bacterium]|nr:heparinase II/III family protein [Verrucomicrobiae bacterium]